MVVIYTQDRFHKQDYIISGNDCQPVRSFRLAKPGLRWSGVILIFKNLPELRRKPTIRNIGLSGLARADLILLFLPHEVGKKGGKENSEV